MGDDFQIVLRELGPMFVFAIGLEAASLVADTAGNQRGGETEEHSQRLPLNSLLHGAASLVTPGVLMIYGWFAMLPHGFQTRVSAVLVIIAVMVVATILGWGLGRLGGARIYRIASVPLALIACGFALFLAWPTLSELADALREGRAIMVAPELQMAVPPAPEPAPAK